MVTYRISDGTSLRVFCWNYARAVFQPKTFLVRILLLIVGHACVGKAYGQDPQPDERPHQVHGIVINSVTRAPISRALVYTADNRYAALTDSEGRFEFTLPRASTEATEVSFEGQPQRVWSGAGSSESVTARKPGFLSDPNDNRLFGMLPISDITISLMPEALIKGRVILSEADAAVGTNVQIFNLQVQDGLPRWMPSGSATTNSTGEFRFAELMPGTYKLVTDELMDNDPVARVPGSQLYGYPPIYYPGVTDFSAAGTIQLTAGQIFQADVSVSRQPYYPVKMPVTNEEAAGGMNISVSVQGHRGPGYSLGYNAEKKQIEGLLPSGNYLVEATTYGPTSARGTANLAVRENGAEGPVMTLSRSSSIPLEVQEEFTSTTQSVTGSWSGGKRIFAMHGPRVYLQARVEPAEDFEQQVSGQIRPPMGPNDDSMVIENVPPGRYWLRLSSGRGYVASATLGGVDLLREPLVVGAGSSMPIEIKVRDDDAELEGSVAGMTGRSTGIGGIVTSKSSSSRAWVYCVPLPDSSGQFTELGVSDEGEFSQKMVPGSYRVMAFDHPQSHLPYRDAAAMRPYETKGQVIHLSGGQKATLQVHISSSSE